MNWRYKSLIQRVVARVPAGDTLYYAMQRMFGNLRHVNPLDYFRGAAWMLDWLEASGRPTMGKRFVEVGTGRILALPTALWLCGAESVLTVDLNRYLSEELVAHSNEFVRTHETEVREAFGVHAHRPGFSDRLSRLRCFSGSLADFLNMTNIEYRSPADASQLPVPEHSIDYHVSRTVLEHIPLASLRRILREARRVLAPSGAMLHAIDPSDHFAHDDKTITTVNFLQFNDADWDRLAGNRFMYHNRLRGFEFAHIFEEAGFRIVRKDILINERALALLEDGFAVDERFRGMSPTDLAVESIKILAE